MALELAARQLGISHARLAVDVGCGTGLSTRAVLDVAERVLALDAAAAMLRAAEPSPRACYVVAAAEQIPVRDGAADLVTVGAAFHWFHQPRAIAELARVLRPGAGLVVYSDFFLGQLAGLPAFSTWLAEVYLPRYPTPARHAHFDEDAVMRAGFTDVRYAEERIGIPMTRGELADYLLTQSNAATAIQSGEVTADALHGQILGETAAFFPAEGQATAEFGIRIWTSVRGG